MGMVVGDTNRRLTVKVAWLEWRVSQMVCLRSLGRLLVGGLVAETQTLEWCCEMGPDTTNMGGDSGGEGGQRCGRSVV